MAKKKPQAPPPSRRKRRGIDERIAALEAKILAIKDREARKQAKSDPALRNASAAVRSLDKALAAVKDAETREALETAREALANVLGRPRGEEKGRVRRSTVEIDNLADALLNYLHNNPGQRGEEIAAAMAVDTSAMRPVMKKLIAAGKVRTEGQRRAMRYTAV
jgi:hypothetical protein